MDGDGVLDAVLELVAIEEARALLAGPGAHPFSAEELRFARSKSDPERRLAARLAAKRGAVRLLGAGVSESDFEIVRSPGRPPQLFASERARTRLLALRADRFLVSLTHGREHAAASVLLVSGTS